MNAKRIYLAVALCAVVVYLGALWNRFAFDDLPIVLWNSLFGRPGAWWRAFGASYWPPELGGGMYRPLTISTYALDWLVGRIAWFHAANLLWHAGASVALAAIARRWSGDRAALAAGLIFAVHPVHVEAVANVAGRAELMAALFALLAVYGALVRDHLGWSVLAAALGLLSKENAAVVPGLIAWGWIVGLARPTRRRYSPTDAGDRRPGFRFRYARKVGSSSTRRTSASSAGGSSSSTLVVATRQPCAVAGCTRPFSTTNSMNRASPARE